MGNAKLTVVREHRSIVGRFGVFNIFVNDLAVGQIKDGETRTFDIPTGDVVIQMAGTEGGTSGERTKAVACAGIVDAEDVRLYCCSVGMKNRSGIEVWKEGEEQS